MSRSIRIAAFAYSRWGRAALHFGCLVRGGRVGWHLRGIVRELFCRSRPGSETISGSFSSLSALLLCAITGGALPVFAFPGASPLELLPAAAVDGSGIFLHQVSSAGVSNLPAPIRLANAPAFGQVIHLSRAQIAEALKTAMPELATKNWAGAAQVRITRRARSLAERELRELLTATLQRDHIKDKGELELRFSRSWNPVYVPDEPFELKVIDLPASGVGPNFITRFELLAGPERIGPWQVVAQARVMREVLVARTALMRNQPLQGADFTTERRDVLALREPVDSTALNNPSLELIENVSAGQPLPARAVRLRPVVLRGQFIDGLIRDGTLNISLKVEALADGQPGQMIRVRNPKTKREFHAKVQNEQSVLIVL